MNAADNHNEAGSSGSKTLLPLRWAVVGSLIQGLIGIAAGELFSRLLDGYAPYYLSRNVAHSEDFCNPALAFFLDHPRLIVLVTMALSVVFFIATAEALRLLGQSDPRLVQTRSAWILPHTLPVALCCLLFAALVFDDCQLKSRGRHVEWLAFQSLLALSTITTFAATIHCCWVSENARNSLPTTRA
ncbi:hypothetical protein [Rubinisphaera sp. JC750]|uniref:hypothetical protein n=1 Tax=Rubinisphaera sp. JC750 TaxID=2898658 RepID=UPI001F3A1B9E|nr:hypothetical protein [Rubinisphaera sp. JC750]